MDQDDTWHGGRPQHRRPCGVRWGHSPLSKKGAEPPPQFSAHFYCGQTAGCTKMPLGMELGLSPGDFVLKRGRSPPIFFGPYVYCGQTAGWIKMALGIEVDLNPGDFVLDGDPAPPQKGADPLPNFRPMSTVACRACSSTRCCKNIINLTARTGGMYGGRPVPFSPSTASTGCGVLRSTAAVGRSTASVDNGQRVAVMLRVASAEESWFYAPCDNRPQLS